MAFTTQRIIRGCSQQRHIELVSCPLRGLNIEVSGERLIIKSPHYSGDITLTENARALCDLLKYPEAPEPLRPTRNTHPILPKGEPMYWSGTCNESTDTDVWDYLYTALLVLFYLSVAGVALLSPAPDTDIWMAAIWVCWAAQSIPLVLWIYSLVSMRKERPRTLVIGRKGIYIEGESAPLPLPGAETTLTIRIEADEMATLHYTRQEHHYSLNSIRNHARISEILWRLCEQKNQSR